MMKTITQQMRVSKKPYERNAEKCNFCRLKKTKCLPRHRNWSAGEKCSPCQRGGQACGPNVRFSSSTSPSLPRKAGLLLPRPESTQSSINHSNDNALPDFEQAEPPPATGYSTPGFSRAVAEQQEGSVSHFVQMSVPTSPTLLKSSEKLEQQENDASILSTRLGHLRTILEHIRALQRSLASHNDTKEASMIRLSLEFYVGWIKANFVEIVKNLLRIADSRDAANTKLIYREAAELTDTADCGMGEFLELRAKVLRRLISIYREEGNLRFVKTLLVELANLGCSDKSLRDTQAASDLAQCYEDTAAELGKVFDDMKLTIKPPLHRNPATPFPAPHHALREGHDEVIRLLCENSAALKERDMLRQTTLIVAAALGKTDLFQPAFHRDPTLLQDRDSQGRPPLFHAACSGEFKSFSELAEAGAKLTDRGSSSRSILQVAAASGNIATVSYMLEKGVSPNDDQFHLTSPLHEAAREGHEDVCKLLLDHGAWANCRLLAGGETAKTPGEIAMDNNFPDLSAIIDRASSCPNNNIYPRNPYQEPHQQPYQHLHQHPVPSSPEQSYHDAHPQHQQAQDASASNKQSSYQSPPNSARIHPSHGPRTSLQSPRIPRTPEVSQHVLSDLQRDFSHYSSSCQQLTLGSPSARRSWDENASCSSPTTSCPTTQLCHVGSVS